MSIIHQTATLSRVTSVLASISGLVVGLMMLNHRVAEPILAISVISGHLSSLIVGHMGSHDPNHIVVHSTGNRE